MTKVILPPITFSYSFKTKKEAKQEAIKAFMGMINDFDILGEIEVVEMEKPCSRCPKNKCKNCPVKKKENEDQ